MDSQLPADRLKKSVVFMYPDIASPTIRELDCGKAPKEQLSGFYQLRERGWSVRISDARWTARTSKIRRKLRRFIHWPSWRTIIDWNESDIVVIKDEFSIIFTLLIKLLGKNVVYLDTMFAIPKRKWRRFFIRFSLKHADQIIALSKYQSKQWAMEFSVPHSTFLTAPYCLDTSFYDLGSEPKPTRPMYVLSVGRDLGRDFNTLIQAVKLAKLHLKIVTLPYLLPDNIATNKFVEVLERLSYSELFKLYRHASLVIVPLKAGIDYASGIRAVMESLALGLPTIATRTPILDEYFVEDFDLVMCMPEDPEALASNIQRMLSNDDFRKRLASNGRSTMKNLYKLSNYTSVLEGALLNL